MAKIYFSRGGAWYDACDSSISKNGTWYSLANASIMKDGTWYTNSCQISNLYYFNDAVNNYRLQNDEKVVVGGVFTEYSGATTGVTRNGIIRLNTDGNVDESFQIGTGFNNIINKIRIQSDNKILVGGTYTQYSGVTKNRFIRLNTDGSIDETFEIGSGFNSGNIAAIALQNDGKVLVGGSTFTTYSGISRTRLARLNTGGTIDETFQIGTGFNGSVVDIIIQSDNKILIGGVFTTYSGVTRNGIIRLNTDGNIDGTFQIGSGFNSFVDHIEIQSDNKILVGGGFTTYSGVSKSRIVRLNTDGSIDETFQIGSGFDNIVRVINIQSDNKILVGGTFTTYSGVSKNGMVRLNTDGSIDETFQIGTGFNDNVLDILELSNGNIIVGGAFTEYNTQFRGRIALLDDLGNLL